MAKGGAWVCSGEVLATGWPGTAGGGRATVLRGLLPGALSPAASDL